jgi:hypothetical protein
MTTTRPSGCQTLTGGTDGGPYAIVFGYAPSSCLFDCDRNRISGARWLRRAAE